MIFHLAAEADWDGAETYRPASLEEEGFIHCSTAAQLIGVANSVFAGRDDLVLVTIEPDLLRAPVVFEDCYDTGLEYPHIYGTIDAEAVVAIEPFPPDDDGRFSWDHDASH